MTKSESENKIAATINDNPGLLKAMREQNIRFAELPEDHYLQPASQEEEEDDEEAAGVCSTGAEIITEIYKAVFLRETAKIEFEPADEDEVMTMADFHRECSGMRPNDCTDRTRGVPRGHEANHRAERLRSHMRRAKCEIIMIDGIRCELSMDKHGFFDADIYHEMQTGETLFGLRNGCERPIPYMEWIVRGMVDRQEAVDLARKVIAAKREGCTIFHDAEGIVRAANFNHLLKND
jgi:hypothetical protein